MHMYKFSLVYITREVKSVDNINNTILGSEEISQWLWLEAANLRCKLSLSFYAWKHGFKAFQTPPMKDLLEGS